MNPDLTAPVDAIHADSLLQVTILRDLFTAAHADVDRRAHEWLQRLTA